MIKPFTCLCLFAAFGAGLYLYSEKHRTALLDRDIGQVIHKAEAARARTGLLRAEWALLNEPGRLADMAGRYLTLHPMAPTQFVQVSDLAAHLPAVMTAPADNAADDDDTPAPAPLPPEAAPMMASAGTGLPAHHPMLPPGHADAHTAPRLLAHADARHAPHHVEVADRTDMGAHDSLLAHGTPLPLAAPRPLGASVYNAMARPMRTPATHAVVVNATTSYAPAMSAAPVSALGGQGSVPPPVPYGR